MKPKPYVGIGLDDEGLNAAWDAFHEQVPNELQENPDGEILIRLMRAIASYLAATGTRGVGESPKG